MRLDARIVAVLAALLGAGAPARAQDLPSANARVLGVLAQLRATLRTTRYEHRTHIDARAGIVVADCSAFVAWVLQRAAPRSFAALHAYRPLAVDLWRTLATAPTSRPRNGWLRIARVADARPGDLLAWPRPRWFPSHNTGHTAFVVAPPVTTPDGVLVRVVDSTSIGHQDDTRAPGVTGVGEGTLLVSVDAITGEGTAYGWIGARTPPEWRIATPVRIGRAMP